MAGGRKSKIVLLKSQDDQRTNSKPTNTKPIPTYIDKLKDFRRQFSITGSQSDPKKFTKRIILTNKVGHVSMTTRLVAVTTDDASPRPEPVSMTTTKGIANPPTVTKGVTKKKNNKKKSKTSSTTVTKAVAKKKNNKKKASTTTTTATRYKKKPITTTAAAKKYNTTTTTSGSGTGGATSRATGGATGQVGGATGWATGEADGPTGGATDRATRSATGRTVTNERYPKRKRVQVQKYTDKEIILSDFYDYDLDYETEEEEFVDEEDKEPSPPPPVISLNIPKEVTIKPSSCSISSDTKERRLGVFAVQLIPKGVQIGPYEGIKLYYEDLKEGMNTNYMWEVRQLGELYFIDGHTENHWMKYINCARNDTEQNLIAFQYQGDVYYQTIKDIKPNNELCVWYCDEYAEELGISMNNDDDEQHDDDDSQMLICNNCGIPFLTQTDFDKHLRTKRSRCYETFPKIFTCQRCHISFTRLHQLQNHLRNHELIKQSKKFQPIAVQSDTDDYSYTSSNSSNSDSEESIIKEDRYSGKRRPASSSEARKEDYSGPSGNESMEEEESYSDSRNGSIVNDENYDIRTSSSSNVSVKDEGNSSRDAEHDTVNENNNYRTSSSNRVELVQEECNSATGISTVSAMKVSNSNTISTGSDDETYYSDHSNYQSMEDNDSVTSDESWQNNYSSNSSSDESWEEEAYSNSETRQPRKRSSNISNVPKPNSGRQSINKRNNNRTKPSVRQSVKKSNSRGTSEETTLEENDNTKETTCHYCETVLDTKHLLQAHINDIHTCDKPFICQHCGKTFASKSELRKHVRIHTGERPYACSYCDKTFIQNVHLQIHLRSNHTGEKPYKCRHCKKRFIRNDLLKAHLRHHADLKSALKCQYCDKIFNQASQLRKHIEIHTGKKVYKCKQCGKKFEHIWLLKSHVRIHTGQKPYKCSFCGKTFAQSGVLTRHLRMHTGDKPFKCSYCDKEYSQRGSLRRHVLAVHNEGHQPCKLCGKELNDNCYAKKHQCSAL